MKREMQTGMTDIVLAHWDLSTRVTPTSLGSRFDNVVIAETLGNERVDTEIILPGGDIVSGMFRTVTATTGRDGTISAVHLASVRRESGRWAIRIDEFVTQFGGDRQAIDAYLAEVLPAVAVGEVDPEQSFRGDARPGYEPSLQLRPDAGGVVVSWSFFLSLKS